jgi:hypothetical protein
MGWGLEYRTWNIECEARDSMECIFIFYFSGNKKSLFKALQIFGLQSGSHRPNKNICSGIRSAGDFYEVYHRLQVPKSYAWR